MTTNIKRETLLSLNTPAVVVVVSAAAATTVTTNNTNTNTTTSTIMYTTPITTVANTIILADPLRQGSKIKE